MTNVFDFTQPADQPAGAAAPTTKKPQAKLWINLGTFTHVAQEDGTVKEEFINLPVGIALDTMSPMSGNSKLAKRKNLLLDKLQKACASLEPGEQRTVFRDEVTGLAIQMSRASDTASQPTEDDVAALAHVQLNFGS
jgi:hypothetical protein